MTERWATVEEIRAAGERFEARLGWRRPAAWGLLHDGADGGIVVDRANVGDGYVSAVVLATVAGWTDGTRSCRLDADDLDQAIALLAPAEACTEMDHPNLRVWRRLRDEIRDGGSVVAVFVAGGDQAGEDPAEGSVDPYVSALLKAI